MNPILKNVEKQSMYPYTYTQWGSQAGVHFIKKIVCNTQGFCLIKILFQLGQLLESQVSF